MTVEAYAKVNLTLEVYGKRSDGYHALRSVVQPITLADTLEIERSEDGSISSDTGYGEKDLIVKAARCLAAHAAESGAPLSCGCRVCVTKRIPAGGGLGGGSADAAAMLLALNEMWSLAFSTEELVRFGAEVGSDVPALVLAQRLRAPVLMEGRGERVSVLPAGMCGNVPTSLVLANPGVHSSTPEVFAHCTPRADAEAIPPFRNDDDFRFFNDLQPAATALHPEIGEALAALREMGARDVMMSGSGATVFGFAADPSEADRIAQMMRARGYSAWACERLTPPRSVRRG